MVGAAWGRVTRNPGRAAHGAGQQACSRVLHSSSALHTAGAAAGTVLPGYGLT